MMEAMRLTQCLQQFDQARAMCSTRATLMYALNTGPLEHRLLAGIEVGKQITNNLRKTGYFGTDQCQTDHPDDPEDDALPSQRPVPISNPRITDPVDFRLDAVRCNQSRGCKYNGTLHPGSAQMVEVSGHTRIAL